MSIEVTYQQLKLSEQAFGELSQLKVKAVVSSVIKRAAKVIAPEMDVFNTTWGELVQRIGTPAEGKPGIFVIPPEKAAEFNAEAQPLLDKKITLPIDKIKVADLGDAMVSASMLTALDWLIED